MKRKFKIENPWANNWECFVEIDIDFIIPTKHPTDTPYTTVDAMREMILFWSNGKERLEENNGDVLLTFLQQLGREVMIIQSQEELTVYGINEEFKEKEGWCIMDGSCGITLIDADEVDFSYSNFYPEEIING